MVRLEEVKDEAFLQSKEFDDDDDYTDTGISTYSMNPQSSYL